MFDLLLNIVEAIVRLFERSISGDGDKADTHQKLFIIARWLGLLLLLLLSLGLYWVLKNGINPTNTVR